MGDTLAGISEGKLLSKKWRRAFSQQPRVGLQRARARAKQDWLARLAAAPPGDSFVTWPSFFGLTLACTCLH